MRRTALTVLVAALVAGCSTGRRLESTSNDIGPARGVELIVRNETQRFVRAFVQWERGPRSELGQLDEGTGRMFTTPARGRAMRVEFSRTPQQGGAYAYVERGDRLEWVLQATGDVYFRRITP